MSGIGESRTELINWLNDLLHLNYKKIEECGSGAAYCQIMDSIYYDIPMHRVKFDATAEYEFQTNFKILQSSFTKHHIEKTVYVEKLIRCRFQDNLEFLQWLKKYWLQNKDETPYDPDSRRKHRPAITSTHQVPGGTISVNKRKTSGTPIGFGASNYGANSATSSLSSSYGVTRRVSNEQALKLQNDLSQATSRIASLNKEIGTYKEAMNIMEKERDFYFSKLRDIEILAQSTQDLINEGVYNAGVSDLSKVLNKVQQILYATEDGFVVNQEDPQLDEEIDMEEDNQRLLKNMIREVPQDVPAHNLITDEETF